MSTVCCQSFSKYQNRSKWPSFFHSWCLLIHNVHLTPSEFHLIFLKQKHWNEVAKCTKQIPNINLPGISILVYFLRFLSSKSSVIYQITSFGILLFKFIGILKQKTGAQCYNCTNIKQFVLVVLLKCSNVRNIAIKLKIFKWQRGWMV